MRIVKRSARWFLRRVKAAQSSMHDFVGDRRADRSGLSLDYFAIHDGRTLNVCVNANSRPASLVLEGSVSIPLPEPRTESEYHVWAVDLLSLGLPPGTYALKGADGPDESYPLYPRRASEVRSDEPATDGKIVDLNHGSASIVVDHGTAGVVITGGSDFAQLAALNYSGPDSFRIEMQPICSLQSVIATSRETGEAVVIGEIVDGAGVLAVTTLESGEPPDESRWDVTIRDGAGNLTALHGPASDYARPDLATSFGDISRVESGTRRSWKPYISRTGVLSIRVTSEQMKGAE